MRTTQPIFKSIFAEQWEKLPAVMHKHYANRAYSEDLVTVAGKLDVEFGWWVKTLSPFLRIFGALVPYQGNNIPVTVRFRSELGSAAYCLERIFNFPDQKNYIFYSKMIQVKDDVIVENMKYGIGWKHRFYYNGNKVILEHIGYVLSIFGKSIPIPLNLFLGRGYAEEEAIDENRFRMKMNITHSLFGKIYEYRGEFEMLDE